MFLYRSNRSERLVRRLAEVVSGPRDPFEAETIVVQSRGMERWLAMQLSDRLGVWAHADFPFPRALIERAASAVLGPAEGGEAFGEEALTWAVARHLPPLLKDPAFAPLARYLEGDRDGALRIQLAQRIAATFDDYLVYRPDWIARWERGDDDGWESRLWRALCRGREQAHPAARLRALIDAVDRPAPD
ncbi:MAG: exodeoxyribonuclease V subunit gamma, partial [Myxococcales bacterium]|nr:exodeoxyribonuclease V subunit gamma [Myxococcales bacterium]